MYYSSLLFIYASHLLKDFSVYGAIRAQASGKKLLYRDIAKASRASFIPISPFKPFRRRFREISISLRIALKISSS